MSSPGVPYTPLQPIVAYRAVRELLRDPDDTALVFRIIRALTGASFSRLFQRTLAHPTGGVVLNEKRDILKVLQDRDALTALPSGTLGREYARFIEREKITPEGLVDASNEGADRDVFLDDRARVLSDRLRDTHDLWHVVTGYQRDILGENALLAFTYAQSRNHGIGFIVLMGGVHFYRQGYREVLKLGWQAWRRGRRAESLVAADWEALLLRPLHEVRELLGVGEPPVYTPQFSAGALATR